jgi:hypothetical protein
MDNTSIAIYNMRMAGYLMQKGFVLMSMAENRKYEGKNMFIFMNSPQIKEAMQEYLDQQR